jgi:hypothetical protein
MMNWNKQVLVLIQEQDTEIGDRSDIDRVISEINKEKEFAMMKWITSFNDITSWWSIIIKFLFKVKSFRSTDDIRYKLVYAMHEMKKSKIAGILSDTLSNFKLKESDASGLYIVRVTNATQREDIADTPAGINIDYKSDSCALSIAMLAVLIDLKVIKAKRTKQITRTMRTRTKQCNPVLTCLPNILYSVLFVLTCLLNLPFLAIHVPFTCFCAVLNPCVCFIIILPILTEDSCISRSWQIIIMHNVLTFIMFCILAGVLSIFNSWLSISLVIYTIVWPILLHNLLCKSLEFGVVSLPLEVLRKIDFGFLRVLCRQFEIIREQTCVRNIKPILNGLFTLIHIPVIILYIILFVFVKLIFEKRDFVSFSVFYTNFALALGFGIAGGILLLSKVYLVAIIFIIISLYVFFFLCVLHTYCWLEHNLEYGVLSNQCKKLHRCLQNY